MTSVRNFQRTETVICEIEVRDHNNVLSDPATSMKISIIDPAGAYVLDLVTKLPQPMDRDGVGLYHYDYTPGAAAVLGWYLVHYVATDSTRITIEDDGFTLEA